MNFYVRYINYDIYDDDEQMYFTNNYIILFSRPKLNIDLFDVL